jgi:hypothetical protein
MENEKKYYELKICNFYGKGDCNKGNLWLMFLA